MPPIEVVFFRDDDGTVPVLDWLDGLSDKAQAKCTAKIKRLQQMGIELRRPEADYLRDGIYELRIALKSINYRILYFFHKRTAIVLAHGLVKERVVPPIQIDWAVERRRHFLDNPERHTHREE